METIHVDHPAFDAAGNPITWQDIRLVAGEGKLSKKTVKQAVEVITKQRRERAELLQNYKRV